MNFSSTIINIFIGTISGIITSVVLWFFYKIYIKVFLPWYQTLVYKGNSIEGEWYGHDAMVEATGEYKEKLESVSTILLKQQGNKIIGELLLTMQPSGQKCRKLFHLEGSFIDTILMLQTKVKDSNNMGTGALIMKLTENGEKLKGKHIYVSSYDWNTIAINNQVWVRKSNHING